MSKKIRSSHVRANIEETKLLKSLRRKLGSIEDKDITTQEILRRTFKIPSVKEILLMDSHDKRRISERKKR